MSTSIPSNANAGWVARILVGLLWLVSLILTYLAADSRPAQDAAAPQPDPVLSRPVASARLSGERGDQDARRLGRVGVKAATGFASAAAPFGQSLSNPEELPPLRSDEAREYLALALRSDDLVLRNSVVGTMLARLSPENVREVLGVFESASRSYLNDHDYRMFLHAWAKMDGRGAIAYLRENPEAHRVEHGAVWAMSGWAQADIESAYDFVHAGDRVDHGLLYGLVRGWARADLAEADAYVEAMDDQKLRRRMVGVVAESYLEQHGVGEALAWVSRVTAASEDRGYALATLEDTVKRGASQDAAQVAEWLQLNPDNPNIKPWMFEHTAGQMAQRDPRLAAAWVQAAAQDDRVNGGAVRRVVDAWAGKDPVAASQWVDSFRDTNLLTKEVASHLAGNWAPQDTNGAFDWADTLEPGLRREAFGAIVGRMPHDELAATGDWIRGAPVDPVMDNARGAYAWRTFDESPLVALEQVSLITDDKGRERVTMGIAEKMMHQDPEAALAWLPSSGLSEQSQQRLLREGRKRDR